MPPKTCQGLARHDAHRDARQRLYRSSVSSARTARGACAAGRTSPSPSPSPRPPPGARGSWAAGARRRLSAAGLEVCQHRALEARVASRRRRRRGKGRDALSYRGPYETKLPSPGIRAMQPWAAPSYIMHLEPSAGTGHVLLVHLDRLGILRSSLSDAAVECGLAQTQITCRESLLAARR
jgi:hypothetical protein